MDYKINLSEVDTDGAIQEAEAAVAGDTRLNFLRKAGITGGAVMGGGAVLAALAPEAMAAKTGQTKGHGRPPRKFGKGDIGILNYALTLEYLESAFYADAVRSITFSDPHLKAVAVKIAQDEQAHVSFLAGAIPARSRVAQPTFNFQGTTKNQTLFFATAQVLENTGVGAYTGQGFNISKAAYLKAAISILTIEARHAGAIGYINDATANAVAPNGPFDRGVTAAHTLVAVAKTHFIV
ncbi:MAG: ferritin-like domain-containing protein [Solirubrobacteraceae bacterium]